MQRRGSRRKSVSIAKLAFGVALAVALLGPAGLPAGATTTPSSTLLVEVVVMPHAVVVGKYASSATHDGLIPLGGTIPRGDFLNFRIVNHGKQSIKFTAFGKKTATIKPGGLGHFNVFALRRGNYPYRTTTSGGKSFRGVFSVT